SPGGRWDSGPALAREPAPLGADDALALGDDAPVPDGRVVRLDREWQGRRRREVRPGRLGGIVRVGCVERRQHRPGAGSARGSPPDPPRTGAPTTGAYTVRELGGTQRGRRRVPRPARASRASA